MPKRTKVGADGHEYRTKAGVALGAWLDKSDISKSEFARRIGSKQSTISALVLLGIVPRAPLAVAIEKETGGKVKVAWWGVRSAEVVDVTPREVA